MHALVIVYNMNSIIKLTKEELKELRGGNKSTLISAGDEIKNINETAKCFCTYSNMTSLINKNSVDGCLCTCTK